MSVRTRGRAGLHASARLRARAPSPQSVLCSVSWRVVFYLSNPSRSVSVFTWMLMFVIPQLAAGPRSLRGDTAALVRTCIPSDMGIRTVYLVLCPTISPATPRSDHDGRFSEPRLDWRLSLQFKTSWWNRTHCETRRLFIVIYQTRHRTQFVPRYMVPYSGRAILRCRASRGPLAAGPCLPPECVCCLLCLCTSEQFVKRSEAFGAVPVNVSVIWRSQVPGGAVQWTAWWSAVALCSRGRVGSTRRDLPVPAGGRRVAPTSAGSVWCASHVARRLPSALPPPYSAAWSQFHTTTARSVGWTTK